MNTATGSMEPNPYSNAPDADWKRTDHIASWLVENNARLDALNARVEVVLQRLIAPQGLPTKDDFRVQGALSGDAPVMARIETEIARSADLIGQLAVLVENLETL